MDAAAPSRSSGQPAGDGDWQQDRSRRPFGAVLITVPDGAGWPLPASKGDGLEAALLDHAGAPLELEEDGERARPRGHAFSPWRAAVAVLAVAALAAAGYVWLYAGGDAGGVAWRLLKAREEEDRDVRRSFLLPLYPKPRRSGGGAPENLTAGNVPPTTG